MSRGLRACVLLAALAPLSAAAGEGSLPCKDGLAPWKGKTVEELTRAWGPPTSEKDLSRGRRKLVYDLVPDAPRVGRPKPAAAPVPPRPTDVPGREEVTARTTYEKGEDGWKARPEDTFPEGPAVVGYEFEVGPDGTILKARCRG